MNKFTLTEGKTRGGNGSIKHLQANIKPIKPPPSINKHSISEIIEEENEKQETSIM